jgi:hypothetical protein
MGFSSFARLSIVSFSLAACGGQVVFESGSGQGGSTTVASSSHTASGTTTATLVSSSSTGVQPCMGSIDVAVDNGAPVHWTAICFNAWGSMWSQTAVGYLFSAGPSPIGVRVEGCENSGDLTESPGIRLMTSNAMTPGTYTMGSIQFTPMAGMNWSTLTGAPFEVKITKLDPVGGYIDGTFSGVVAAPGGGHSLAGSFHVCRVEDQLGQG